jgi:hypothetical protein
MYIKDGIAYADNPQPVLKVYGVRPMACHKLWVRFNTGEAKIVDFTPLLDQPAFLPLQDEKLFQSVYIDYGMTVWDDGKIDISPEILYDKGVLVDDSASA